jgi:putative membrane protein insertion efficiency factor
MDTIAAKISQCVCRACLILIILYQYSLSPLLRLFGCQCRFYPSCSAYARIVFETHPPLKAFYLVIKRVLSCNPYFQGGYDSPLHKQYKKGQKNGLS